MKFADALHRLDTFPTIGRGKHKYVESKHIFTHPPASPAIAARAVVKLAQFKAVPSYRVMLMHPTQLIPTQNGIYRKKVETDILKDRLAEPIVVWKYRGKFYILDGHHRAATALLVGATIIQAGVV